MLDDNGICSWCPSGSLESVEGGGWTSWWQILERVAVLGMVYMPRDFFISVFQFLIKFIGVTLVNRVI